MNKSTTYTKKGAKSDNFCYRKVGRAITKWGAILKYFGLLFFSLRMSRKYQSKFLKHHCFIL